MNSKALLKTSVFVYFLITIKHKVTANKNTLILVHVIFRHGDKTPDKISLSPSSPYYDESNYAPFGYGQLTNKGKLRTYNVGTALRERYNGFLDETYNIDLIEPRSTYYNRTKESLQAMLAGLFPPTKDLVWLEGFNWQPIAINYLERRYDKIFRHGDRNPDIINLYPSSPYYDESNYAPFGYGQLTNKGKLRAYNVGTALRERYNGFLEETYSIDLIEPRSSDFNRTKASLQAMLAGLFPPTKDLVWLEGLNWQPIPFSYLERQYDKELFCYGCPNWDKTLDGYLQSKNGLSLSEKYQDTFNYISENTGEKITTLLQVYYMYFGFVIQEELNFTLPEWTEKVYPYPMKNITTTFYDAMFSTGKLRKISDYLLKKIIIDTTDKIKGNLPKKKMFIYAGHENNIATFLKVVGWNTENVPPYGSYILFELHKINGTYGVKLFYQNYSTDQPIPLQLTNCEEFCPFDTFVSLTKKFIPEDDSICGTASIGSKMTSSSYHIFSIFVFIKIYVTLIYFI